jgi:hypothetical protein
MRNRTFFLACILFAAVVLGASWKFAAPDHDRPICPWAIWSHTVRAAPHNWRAWHNLAAGLIESGRAGDAALAAEQALSIQLCDPKRQVQGGATPERVTVRLVCLAHTWAARGDLERGDLDAAFTRLVRVWDLWPDAETLSNAANLAALIAARNRPVPTVSEPPPDPSWHRDPAIWGGPFLPVGRSPDSSGFLRKPWLPDPIPCLSPSAIFGQNRFSITTHSEGPFFSEPPDMCPRGD